MEQQDYLKRQIDQLGQMLVKLFSDLLGLKNLGQISVGIELTNKILKTGLDYDIQELMDLPTSEFVDSLLAKKNLNNHSLNKLVGILLLIADNHQGDNKKLYEKCLAIYEYLEKAENVYSIARQAEMKRIKSLL